MRRRVEDALERLREGPPGAADVHALRVHCKVLRAGWQLLAPALGSRATRPEERALRDAGRALRRQREARVLRDTLDALIRRARRRERTALVLLHELIRQRDPDEPVAAPSTEGLAAIFEAQHAAIAAWPRAFAEEALREGVFDSYRRARRFGRKALAGGPRRDESWHRCRRWVKYELYQRDLLAKHGARPGRRHRRLERLGRELGRFHDLCDLRGMVAAQVEGLREQGIEAQVHAALERESTRLRRRIERDFSLLYRRRPAAQWRRLGRLF
jgi:hypothetical protein